MEAKAREHEAKISKSSGQEALDHAIQAAELYMKAVREATTAAHKLRLKRKCQDLIALAETIKPLASGAAPRSAPPPAAASSANAPKTRGPRQSRELPTNEKTILLRSSKLHGSIFPPWDRDPDQSVFRSKRLDEPPFTDPSPFSFSTKQNEIFDGWKRPAELFNDSGPELYENMMVAKTDCDLVQDITTDCSVVASLCAVMRHLKPGRKNSLLPTLLYPFDHDKGRPVASQNGKYMFRLNFNGCFRQIVVDDRLPASKTSRTFFVVDRRNPELIWPALMEKAYLKIRGGYDFPGSNSGTDLWVLTGWIPEQIFLQSDDTELDQTWKRIKTAYEYGDVVVTLGTGRLSRQEEDTLGLAGEHDYAVMDLKLTETGEQRMLLKNPWCDGLVWKGLGSATTIDAEAYPPPSPTLSRPSIPRADSDSSLSPYEDMTGTFWISFSDVVQNFESLYLNWNPSLFSHRQDHHFTWELPSRAMQRSFAHNPQYAFTAPSSGAVWVLLSRHFQDGELPIARSRATRQPPATSLAEVSNSLGFMSIYLFSTASGHRVQLPAQPAHQSPFVDSPQTLLRFDAKPNIPYTVVVAQAALPLPRYTFTLSVFSRAPLTISRAESPLAHYAEVPGSWTRRTAGGNARTPTFFTNPQYALTVSRATPISLLLASDADDVPVHVDLVWSSGQRVTALTVRDIVVSSGEYRRGCALAEARAVDPGTYTIVASTFEPGQLAAFVLRVGSDVPVTLRPVLSDAAGRLRTELEPVVFRAGESERKRARLNLARLTRASVVARSAGILDGGASAASSGTTSPAGVPVSVRVSIEYGSGARAHTAVVTSDGEFADASMGLRTAEVDLDPDSARRTGGLWLVVEQMGLSHRAGQGIQVDVLSDGRVAVGEWEEVDD
ncbi:cysteine protease [Gnomoniopsis sp. IMI 355080]|nr:cysteine protease [Gnomoniopsis sp. IMI 355080]